MKITEIAKNMKFTHKYTEHLIYKLCMIISISYHDIDHIWYLLATGTPCRPHRIAVKLIK